MSAGRIAGDPSALMGEANRILRVVESLDRAAADAGEALELRGLPGYVCDAQSGVMDIRRNIRSLTVAAMILRSKATLLRVALEPGCELLATRLKFYDSKDFSWSAFRDAVFTGKLLTPAAKWNAKMSTAELADWLEKQHIKLPPKQLRSLRADLVNLQGEWHRPHFFRKWKVDYATALRAVYPFKEQVKALREFSLDPNKSRLNRLGSGPFDTGVDFAWQIGSDLDEEMSLIRRVERAGVAAGYGVAGSAVAALTGPLAPFTSVGTGTIANVWSAQFNAKYLPSESEKVVNARRERAAKVVQSFRRIEQWYVDNGRPTKAYLDQRLKDASKMTQTMGSDRFTTYRWPDNNKVAAERAEFSDGSVQMTYFDEHGKPFEPKP